MIILISDGLLHMYSFGTPLLQMFLLFESYTVTLLKISSVYIWCLQLDSNLLENRKITLDICELPQSKAM